MTVMSLAAAAPRQPLVVDAPAVDPAAAHRLMTLGWRPGARVQIIRRTLGGAHIIALAGARVAVGRRLAKELQVRPVSPEAAGPVRLPDRPVRLGGAAA